VHREVVMKKWLRRIRGAVGMGLTWAAGWALVGVLIELFMDPNRSLVDVWPTALAIPGFLGARSFPRCFGLQRAVADSMGCRFPDSAPRGR